MNKEEQIKKENEVKEPNQVSIRKTGNGYYVTYGFLKEEMVFLTKKELLEDLNKTWKE